VMRKAGSRRESLSLSGNELNMSSGNDSGDDATVPQTPGVVRRPVTRRGNLLVSPLIVTIIELGN
jgi:capping protein alpha